MCNKHTVNCSFVVAETAIPMARLSIDGPTLPVQKATGRERDTVVPDSANQKKGKYLKVIRMFLVIMSLLSIDIFSRSIIFKNKALCDIMYMYNCNCRITTASDYYILCW